MRKTIAIFTSIIFISLSISAKGKFKIDTLKKVRLSVKEAKLIKNLIKTDTIFDPAGINLQLELFKYNPNLIYKYRLDSLNSTVPMDYNSYVQTYIDVFLSKRNEEVGHMVNLGKYYFPIFEKALAAYHVPQEFKYLPIIESSMNPMAVSRVGATGMWQFMYTTGRGYGLNIDNYVDDRRDPIAASYAAAKYLRDAYNELGDWLLALASYNCGKGNITRAIAKAGGARSFWEIQGYLPNETRNYVPAFIAANYIMNYYDKHSQIKIVNENILKTDSVYVNKFISFDKIASALSLQTNDIQNLNPSYKKLLINGTKENPKRLIIPKLTYTDYTKFFDALNADEDESIKIVNVIQQPTKPFKTIIHVVKQGENLIKIANDYRVEVQDIKVWNNLPNYTIAIGQKLVVNKPIIEDIKQPVEKKIDFLAYKVRAGDTLSSIADRFENVTIQSIKELNGLKSSILTIGVILKIKL
jgi:membrane-bound lytic murein transglycosylase D